MIVERLDRGTDTWPLRWAVGRLRSVKGSAPSRATLLAMLNGWGDDDRTVDVAFLELVARAVPAARGPILECGTGVTTVLLAALAKERDIEVWSIDQPGSRQARTSRTLERLGLSVRFCRVVQERNTIVWSDPPIGELPARFDLAVCGPTRWSGLEVPPELQARLDQGAVVLRAQNAVRLEVRPPQPSVLGLVASARA